LAEEVKSVGKVRIYEVAKDIGIANKELVSKIQTLGITVKNHMSFLDIEEVTRIKTALERERQENLVEKRLTSTVIRRRSKKAPRDVAPASEDQQRGAEEASAAVDPAEPGEAQAPQATPADTVDDAQGAAPAEGDAEVTQQAKSVESAEADKAAGPGEATEDAATADTQKAVADDKDKPAAEAADGNQKTPKKPAMAGKVEVTPADPARKLRYAPGYKPGQVYGPKARQQNQRGRRPVVASEEKPISAADALKMMAPAHKPRVVITDLDGRRPGHRREVVTRTDLFKDRRFKGGGRKKRRTASNKNVKKTEITTPAQHKRVIRLQDNIAVGEIARQMGIKVPEVLKHLWGMGLTNIRINQSIDVDTASLLANEFGYEIEDVSFKEEEVLAEVQDREEDLASRPPVVTVMGHVDHGKTSLLDAMRNTSVASGEAGGITQHIGASQLTTKYGTVVFLDTPGHAAFTKMRARGANCTDIVILVVAANDGVMPQTVEALDHSKQAGVPIIVAVNKIDLPDANADRVKAELAERGLIPEEWGGETLFVEVSAKTKEGLDTLQESLNLQAELLELKANPTKPAKGVIIESRLDRSRGAMSTVLVQEGTLKVGDNVVTGEYMGKIRAMLDDQGKQVQEAPPCTPVEVLGLGGVPEAGDMINAVADGEAARVLAEYRQSQHRQRDMATASSSKTYEEILQSIQSGTAEEIKLLVKADVHGSAEAVRESLIKLGTEKVSVNVISSAVGGVTENDVNLAKASGAIIIGFNVRPAGKTKALAEREKVEIRIYDIIYEMMDEVKIMMQGMLPKERREKFLGRAEVREVFTIPKVGAVAGCSVQDGKVTRNSLLRLVRNNIKIYEGRVGSLRRFKEDVKEVLQGYECGIGIEGYNDIKVEDVIEAYEIEEFAPTL